MRFELTLCLLWTGAAHAFVVGPAARSNAYLRMAVDDADREHIKDAISLAMRAGPDRTFPNPAVGCVVVGADGGSKGLGWHPRSGWPHAEVYALADLTGKLPLGNRESGPMPPASPKASPPAKALEDEATDAGLLAAYLADGPSLFAGSAVGATAYVTLEPCSHAMGAPRTGKMATDGDKSPSSAKKSTPPCASTLAAAGVTRVVVGCRDPNPRVDGGGVESLRAAGVTVDIMDGEEGKACKQMVADFAARCASAFDAAAVTGQQRALIRRHANKLKATKSLGEIRVGLDLSTFDAAAEAGTAEAAWAAEAVSAGGLEPAWLSEADKMLRAGEVLLVRVGKSKKVAKALGDEIAARLGAHVAQVVGHTVLLYRPCDPPRLDLGA